MTSMLTLGDSALDEDHARLEELILQLRDAPLDDATPALNVLRIHAQRHFAVEDLELQAMDYGNAKCHLDEHIAVLKSLDEVKAVLTEGELGKEGKALLVRRLATQLLSWLPEHVLEMDASVAAHRSKQRFGGAPVKIAHRLAG